MSRFIERFRFRNQEMLFRLALLWLLTGCSGADFVSATGLQVSGGLPPTLAALEMMPMPIEVQEATALPPPQINMSEATAQPPATLTPIPTGLAQPTLTPDYLATGSALVQATATVDSQRSVEDQIAPIPDWLTDSAVQLDVDWVLPNGSVSDFVGSGIMVEVDEDMGVVIVLTAGHVLGTPYWEMYDYLAEAKIGKISLTQPQFLDTGFELEVDKDKWGLGFSIVGDIGVAVIPVSDLDLVRDLVIGKERLGVKVAGDSPIHFYGLGYARAAASNRGLHVIDSSSGLIWSSDGLYVTADFAAAPGDSGTGLATAEERIFGIVTNYLGGTGIRPFNDVLYEEMKRRAMEDYLANKLIDSDGE